MKMTFAGNQDLLDTLWGYYFATGSHVPILRIVEMLPWTKSRDTVDKLTVGSMARYIAGKLCGPRCLLARIPPQPARAAAGGDQGAAYRGGRGCRHRSARCGPKGRAGRRGRTQDQGSDSRRNLDFWGQVGVGAVALGCVSAAALGQVAVGIPCVIGGSASQGLLSFWEKQQ